MVAGGIWLWSRGVTDLLSYGMLLLCPLMHLFMHGSHGGRHHARRDGGKAEGPSEGDSSCH
ncbi:MAG: DUF2933 domain-containing protein [Bacillota bacterium]